MLKKINGILNLDEELVANDLFVKEVTRVATLKVDPSDLGIKTTMEWELDTITMTLYDKKDNHIGTLRFNNMEFQSLADTVMPPTTEEMKKTGAEYDAMSDEEKKNFQKEIEEDGQDAIDNDVTKKIDEAHKDN